MADFLREELDEGATQTVLRHFENVAVAAGTVLVQAVSETCDMFFLESGTAEVLLDIEGTWARASRIWPGTLFGEIAFHCGGPRTATVRSLEPCRLVRMTRRAVATLERKYPEAAIILHRFLARRAAPRLIFHNDVLVDFFRSTLR